MTDDTYESPVVKWLQSTHRDAAILTEELIQEYETYLSYVIGKKDKEA